MNHLIKSLHDIVWAQGFRNISRAVMKDASPNSNEREDNMQPGDGLRYIWAKNACCRFNLLSIYFAFGHRLDWNRTQSNRVSTSSPDVMWTQSMSTLVDGECAAPGTTGSAKSRT